MSGAVLPVATLLSSLLAALLIFLLPETSHRLRTTINLLAAAAKLTLVGLMVWGVFHGAIYRFGFTMLPGVEFLLRVDALSLIFAGLSAILWLCTTVYAVGYLEDSPNRSRFFGFFSLCVASTLGIALAGNLFTFFLFYEMLTLATYPLVVHRGTEASLRAGRTYVAYTLGGGAMLLLGLAWLQSLAGPLDFADTAAVRELAVSHRTELQWIFVLLVGGLGVKAALVPLHGWLPLAMVAPAPVSALLHAVAVVKAGAYGIVRVVYDVYGIELASALSLLPPLSALAGVTILYGSLWALRQTDLKKRLAYSTISQVSYIVLGASMIGPLAIAGGLAHLIHQGFMKITLFFCAGNYAETLGVHRIDELDGAGRRLPLTSAAFTLAAVGMIGVPPLAGFITKWTLGAGALAAGIYWVLPLLLVSSVLNAMYFLPVVYRLWFAPQRGAWPDDRRWGRLETRAWLLWPCLFTAAMCVLLGLLASAPFSPLFWAELISVRAYTL